MSISGVYLAATSETLLQMFFSDMDSVLDFKVSSLKLPGEIKCPFRVLETESLQRPSGTSALNTFEDYNET